MPLMEEQSTQLHHLMGERFDIQSGYGQEMSYPMYVSGNCAPYQPYNQNQNSQEYYTGYTPNYGTRNMQYCSNTQIPMGNVEKSQLVQGINPQFVSELGRSSNLVDSLNEKVMTLQMANLKLNLFLKKEETRRKNIENDLAKERAYIKKLEDNIQNLRSSRIVMDPKTYKQVADNYIATRKRPVRRSHTCHPCIGQTDLVCDSINIQSQIYGSAVNSCPSSPLSVKLQAAEETNVQKKDFWTDEDKILTESKEYQGLINSLTEIDLASTPP